MAIWMVQTFTKDKQASRLAVQMVPYQDDETTHRLTKAGEEQITTYIEAATFLLTSYTTHTNIAQKLLKIAALEKLPRETSVHFADVLRTKAVCCGNADLKVRTRNVSVQGLQASTQSNVGMF